MIVLAGFFAVIIGVLVSLLGGGGSILTTPLMIYVLGFDPKQAIAASLLVVTFTSAFGLIFYARARRVNWRTGWIFGGASMVGAFIGGQIGSRLPAVVLLTAFSVMMAVTAVAMVRGRRQMTAHAHTGLPIIRILLDGLIVGLVTGLVGAGGGFLVVPALVLLGGLEMQMAVGTALLVVTMKSIAGFLGYLLHFGGESFISINKDIIGDWRPTVVITVCAVIGALIGSRISGRVHPEHLRKAFGWFVLVMAIYILVQQVGSQIWGFAGESPLHLVEVGIGVVLIAAILVMALRWRGGDAATDQSSTVSRRD